MKGPEGGDLLAVAARSHEDGWSAGVVEGAVLVLAATDRAAVVADLVRRFGDRVLVEARARGLDLAAELGER